MLKIGLVNMPFADWRRPSFALSQLSALARREFQDEVDVDVLYLNQDFVSYFGSDLYVTLSHDVDHFNTGVGDWLFRPVAFPDAPDNSEEYFLRYYRGERWQDFRERITELRAGIPGFCAELLDRYGFAEMDVVGLTSMFAQNAPSIALARLVKERSPDTVTIIGGANCEPPMGAELMANTPVLDYVFSGPALVTFPELIRALIDGEPSRADELRGVISRSNHTEPARAALVGADRDINDFFQPDYSQFIASLNANPDLRRMVDNGAKPILFFETSRGCWWGERSHCTFCGLNGSTMEYRSMDPDLARSQLQWLFSHAPWCTTYECTDNIMPKSYPRAVFENLAPPADASLFFEIKLPVSEVDLKRMVQGGVKRLQPGIEALSTDSLSLMRKGTTVFQNLQFLKSCRRFGIEPLWNLLTGFPNEPVSVYDKYVRDIPLLSHLQPPSGAYIVRFDRYSPYFTKPEEYGLELQPLDFYQLVYPFPEESIARLAYFFSDTSLAPYTLNAIEWLDPINQLIAKWQEHWEGDGPTPELSLTVHAGGGSQVLDTRYGSPRYHEFDEVTTAMLRKLSSPMTPARLAKALGLGEAEVARRLATLQDRSLLFEEKDRVMSLAVAESSNMGSEVATQLTVIS